MYKYMYESYWRKYAGPGTEEERFLLDDKYSLSKICEEVDLRSFRNGSGVSKQNFAGKNNRFRPTGSGIPISLHGDMLYTLSEGPHTRVIGESGSKKSRTVCRGAILSAVLKGDSCIVTDPKGELYSDEKLGALLEERDYEVYVLDFQRFDKDGFNIFSNVFHHMLHQDKRKALDAINRFSDMLVVDKKTVDDYWNDEAVVLINIALHILFEACSRKGDMELFNIHSLRAFISQNKEGLYDSFREIKRGVKSSSKTNPVTEYIDMTRIADRTYSCIVSSALTLLARFTSSTQLMDMLSTNSFMPSDFYKKPTVLFLSIPDETSAYNQLTGYIIDIIYQILIDEYERDYQGIVNPSCNIKIICDEIASININDMASKISASRSRRIDWTLIYQSDKQMSQAYDKDFDTICGNCKNIIFLGSSDHEILKDISDMTGVTDLTPDGSTRNMVTVEDLRRMKKRREYKEALVITGNYLYCAKLPDYEYIDIYPGEKRLTFKNAMKDQTIRAYGVYDLEADVIHKGLRLQFD